MICYGILPFWYKKIEFCHLPSHPCTLCNSRYRVRAVEYQIIILKYGTCAGGEKRYATTKLWGSKQKKSKTFYLRHKKDGSFLFVGIYSWTLFDVLEMKFYFSFPIFLEKILRSPWVLIRFCCVITWYHKWEMCHQFSNNTWKNCLIKLYRLICFTTYLLIKRHIKIMNTQWY